MKHNFLAVSLMVAGMAVSASALADKTPLRVYTAFEAVDLPRYKEAFETANPDIEIQWVRDSTGIITAKLLAEKDNPQADAIWGLAASSLLLLKNEGLLEAYAPKGVERLDRRFVDKADVPSWVGVDAWAAALCVNTVELEKAGLDMPASWADLTKAEYQGHIRMPNPASSGTGFLDVSSWLQMMGEDAAWDYMDALDKNINVYTHSGSKPCKDAGRGETTIGISFVYPATTLIEQGAPLEIVIPAEGIGWDAESAAIVRDTDYPDAARKLLDFAISDEAMKVYNEGFAILSVPELAKPVPHYPAEVAEKMIDNDFEWAAQNRERILAEWQQRYAAKSEPK